MISLFMKPKHRIWTSSLLSPKPPMTASMISVYFTWYLLSKFWSKLKADFLIGTPLSTVCLNGPRSIVLIRSFLTGVSRSDSSTIYSACNLKSSLRFGLKAICPIESRAYSLRARSLAPIFYIKIGTKALKWAYSAPLWAEYLNDFVHIIYIPRSFVWKAFVRLGPISNG